MDSEPALVTTDPDVCAGRPCFAGHRLPVAIVLGRLDAGESMSVLQGDYPWLSEEHVAAARAYTAAAPTRRFGLLKGKVAVPPDFDAPLPGAVLGSFQGEAALEGREGIAADPARGKAGINDELEPAAAPTSASAPSKAQQAGRQLADLGSLAPDIALGPRRRPTD